MYTKPLNQISKNDISIAGGKDASLGEMAQIGIRVPGGFVVLASAFDKFLETTDLNIEIDSILHSVDHNKMHTIENASAKIKSLLLKAKMPKNIAEEIRKGHKKLKANYVAVRSSATTEDSLSAAWAGQLETYLNTTEGNLLKNVQKCWASLFTPRAIFYRFEKRLHRQKISVAVVIQKMVNSKMSGIAFSVHPVTEDKNQLVIEVGLGLGEAIVSGQITPDSYVVEKKPFRIIDKNINVQKKALVRSSRGGNKYINIPEKEGEKQVLTDNQILELSRLVLKIENHYNFPQDIEWAYERGKFYIVQSRPITTLKRQTGRQKQKIFVNKKIYKSLAKEYVVSVFPVFMIVPAVKEGWENIMGKGLKNYVLKFENHSVTALIDPADYQKTISILSEKIKNDLNKDFSFINKIIIGQQKAIDKLEGFIKLLPPKANLGRLNNERLYKLLAKFVSINTKVYTFGLLIANFDFGEKPILTSQLMEYLEKKNKKLAGKYFSTLTTPIKETIFSRSETALLEIVERVRKDKTAFAEFNRKSAKDLLNYLQSERKEIYDMFINHTEKFGWIAYVYEGPPLNILYYVGFVKDVLNKEELYVQFKRANGRSNLVKKEQRNILKKLNPNRFYKNLIQLAQEVAFLKVRRRERQSCSYFQIENLLIEISKRCNLSLGQLRMLFPEEIKQLLIRDEKINLDIIERRKKLFLYGYHQKKLIKLTGKEAKNFSNTMVEKEKVAQDLKEIKGNTAYKGKVKGIVKIINVPEDIPKINNGEILVSFATNPNLIPALKKAAAIVTDEGGLTSHAAIVSRELQIPCIVGTKLATKVLKDGDLVEVDANKGVVRILEHAKRTKVEEGRNKKRAE